MSVSGGVVPVVSASGVAMVLKIVLPHRFFRASPRIKDTRIKRQVAKGP